MHFYIFVLIRPPFVVVMAEHVDPVPAGRGEAVVRALVYVAREVLLLLRHVGRVAAEIAEVALPALDLPLHVEGAVLEVAGQGALEGEPSPAAKV